MENLTEEDLLYLHKIVEERFKVFTGVKDQGLVKAIAERPEQKLYGGYTPYNDVFTKAASLMEGIIRMHPFYDGNKRTALLATITYLELNGYKTIIPLSAVRFTVKIARTEKNDPESTTQLILKIATWLKRLSAKNENSKLIAVKVVVYFLLPLIAVLPLAVISFGVIGNWFVGRWMAFDMYPEYKKETNQIASFIAETMRRSFAKEIRDNKK